MTILSGGICSIPSMTTGRRSLPVAKSVAALWGAIIGAWQITPRLIQDSITVAILFFIMDTATGFILAGMEGRLRSRTLMQGALKKALQYLSLVVAFGGFGLIAHNVMIVMPALGIIIMTEASSIVENIYLMERGGAKMPGGLRDMVKRLGKYLAVESPPETVAKGTAKKEEE